MRMVSWNVNGLRACLTKGFTEYFQFADADIFCLQETKMQQGQATVDFPGYEQYWNSAVKKGYSGTAVFTKATPLSVAYDIGVEEHGREGRVITLEYERFALVNVYTPNAQRGLERIDYRMKWEDDFRAYLQKLDAEKPVVICGDMNVAHNEIDLKNAKSNVGNAGFSDQEREKMTVLLDSGFTDSFRYLYPDRAGAYSWWSYMFHARENNAGWRIDYFLVSDRIKDKIKDSVIHPEISGSDHCPVELELFD
jgi:exodeoxyribonuclease-3